MSLRPVLLPALLLLLLPAACDQGPAAPTTPASVFPRGTALPPPGLNGPPAPPE